MTAYYSIPRRTRDGGGKGTSIEYASDIPELSEIVEAYYKAGWELIQMCQKAGYTLVFKRSERA